MMMNTSRAAVVMCAVLASASTASAVTVDGASINWSSTGAGPTAVILIHGWTCDLTSWSEQVGELSRRHRVITIDLPGHGRSGAPQGPLSMDLFVRTIEAVRQEAGIDRAVLIGHSMGATVVARYAQRHPDRTVALVLVDGYLLPPDVRRTLAENASSMRGPEGLKARETLIEGMFTESTHERVRHRIRSMMLRAPETTAEGAMRAMADPDALAAEPIDKPALGIFVQQEAPPGFQGAAEFTKQLLPSLRVEPMPGLGHFPMLEQPADFNQLLVTFLDDVW